MVGAWPLVDRAVPVTLRPLADPPFEELVVHFVEHRFLDEQVDPDRARQAAQAMVERLRARISVLDVLEDGHPIGRVWLIEQDDQESVLRLVLGAPQRAASVRLLVEEVARASGARRLTALVYPGDPVTEAFVADGGFETIAMQMRLDLGQVLPGEDVVALEPMDEAAFTLWEAEQIESYAKARAKSGESPERAFKVAREQHALLLSKGLATEHQRFFVGRVAGTQVGTLWIGTEHPMAFVCDVVVNQAHRRNGYGGGLMRAGALFAQRQGSHALGLNVFGYNHGARSLYDGLGYVAVELIQGKEL